MRLAGDRRDGISEMNTGDPSVSLCVCPAEGRPSLAHRDSRMCQSLCSPRSSDLGSAQPLGIMATGKRCSLQVVENIGSSPYPTDSPWPGNGDGDPEMSQPQDAALHSVTIKGDLTASTLYQEYS